MANTYSQINIHVVFTVFGKENLLLNSFRPDLFKYITGILNNSDEYSLAVNGFKDHVHAFFELKPSHCLSDIVKIVKTNSSKIIPGHSPISNGKHGIMRLHQDAPIVLYR